jgi:hypothetical protein
LRFSCWHCLDWQIVVANSGDRHESIGVHAVWDQDVADLEMPDRNTSLSDLPYQSITRRYAQCSEHEETPTSLMGVLALG